MQPAFMGRQRSPGQGYSDPALRFDDFQAFLDVFACLYSPGAGDASDVGQGFLQKRGQGRVACDELEALQFRSQGEVRLALVTADGCGNLPYFITSRLCCLVDERFSADRPACVVDRSLHLTSCEERLEYLFGYIWKEWGKELYYR